MKIPTIRQLPSGSYFCQLRIDGQSISITDENRDVVEAKAYAYKAGIIKARRSPANLTLREACREYIDGRAARVAESTLQGYDKIIRTSFTSIMDKKLSTITSTMLEDALEQECSRVSRRGKRLAPKTIFNEYRFIASVLHKYVPEIKTDIDLPENKRRLSVILPAKVIYPVIKGTEIELPCLLAMWKSLSMSEIRGLTKSKSIILGQLHVVETVVDIHGKPTNKEGGKEEMRTRVLDIPPYIQGLIDQVVGDRLVTLSGQAIYKRFTRLLEKNGLPHMSFHGLRHVFASTGSALRIADKEIQDMGGWKTDHVMKRVYVQSFSEERDRADAKMNKYFEDVIANALLTESDK